MRRKTTNKWGSPMPNLTLLYVHPTLHTPRTDPPHALRSGMGPLPDVTSVKVVTALHR